MRLELGTGNEGLASLGLDDGLDALQVGHDQHVRRHESLRDPRGCRQQPGLVQPNADVAVVGGDEPAGVQTPADLHDFGANLFLDLHGKEERGLPLPAVLAAAPLRAEVMDGPAALRRERA